MTAKCDHPRNQVVVEYLGRMSFSPDGPSDNFRPVYFCKNCRQVVDQKDLPWLQIEEQAELEQIPI